MTLKHVAQTLDFFIEIIQILSPASFNLILSDEEVGWQVVCFYYLSQAARACLSSERIM